MTPSRVTDLSDPEGAAGDAAAADGADAGATGESLDASALKELKVRPASRQLEPLRLPAVRALPARART